MTAVVVMTGPPAADRAAELMRLKNLKHFELLAEVFAGLPRGACENDVWLLRRYRRWSRDRLITELLPPYHSENALAA